MDTSTMFALYFASIASIARYHPASGTRSHKKPTLNELAAEAAVMVQLTEEITCLGQQSQQQD